MIPPDAPKRNLGPPGGLRLLLWVRRALPDFLFDPLLSAGIWLVMPWLPERRRHIRALRAAAGAPVHLRAVFQTLRAFMDVLVLRLRVAGGEPPCCGLEGPYAADFERVVTSPRPALFGTFHFGHSDLLGFLLTQRGLHVTMVRLRMENSDDVALFERQFAGAVAFIWVNEPDEMLFALKQALQVGRCVAMQCDRHAYTAKTEGFRFLGARRRFPFTIYHLAILFQRPVMFCFGLPASGGGTSVRPMPVFQPDPDASREENLARGRGHFQTVLTELEAAVRRHPSLWFNFEPLNPVVPDREAAASVAAVR